MPSKANFVFVISYPSHQTTHLCLRLRLRSRPWQRRAVTWSGKANHTTPHHTTPHHTTPHHTTPHHTTQYQTSLNHMAQPYSKWCILEILVGFLWCTTLRVGTPAVPTGPGCALVRFGPVAGAPCVLPPMRTLTATTSRTSTATIPRTLCLEKWCFCGRVGSTVGKEGEAQDSTASNKQQTTNNKQRDEARSVEAHRQRTSPEETKE